MVYDPLISKEFHQKVIIDNWKFKTKTEVLYRQEMQKIFNV